MKTKAKRYVNTGEKTVFLSIGVMLLAMANRLSVNDIGFAEAEKAYAEWCEQNPELVAKAVEYQARMFDSLM